LTAVSGPFSDASLCERRHAAGGSTFTQTIPEKPMPKTLRIRPTMIMVGLTVR
jgi:hypothetical protein